jgi:hypothetical protein
LPSLAFIMMRIGTLSGWVSDQARICCRHITKVARWLRTSPSWLWNKTDWTLQHGRGAGSVRLLIRPCQSAQSDNVRIYSDHLPAGGDHAGDGGDGQADLGRDLTEGGGAVRGEIAKGHEIEGEVQGVAIPAGLGAQPVRLIRRQRAALSTKWSLTAIANFLAVWARWRQAQSLWLPRSALTTITLRLSRPTASRGVRNGP